MLIRIIGGCWKRTPLTVLQQVDGLRPTPNRVRETLFNWLNPLLYRSVCIDLFAGSGALGFEAASRGAAHVLMVERDARMVHQLRAIQTKLSADTVEIVQAEALRFATTLAARRFDIVFLDPPFNAINANVLGQALRLSLPLVRLGGAITVESPEPIDQILGPLIENTNKNINKNINIKDAQCSSSSSSSSSSSRNRNTVRPSCFAEGWQITHQKKAGAVYYALLRHL